MTDKELQEEHELKVERDNNAILQTAFNQGVEDDRIKWIKGLYRVGVSVNQIAAARGLTLEEIKEILGLGPKKMEEIMSLEDFYKTPLGKKMYDSARKKALENTQREEYQTKLKEFLDSHTKKYPYLRKECERISVSEYVRGYIEGYMKVTICMLHNVAKMDPDYLEKMGETKNLTMDEVNEILKLPEEFVSMLQKERDARKEEG